ncbi:MAG TPA: hypothetical protein VG013_26385 [Gemmataceae bacterium]|nr:hypothetical protein [Gemmataceae bacterium]
MSKQLMEVVLPRLARRLYQQLQRYRAGELDDSQFTQAFESLLQRQHSWLAERGVSDARAALAIHGAVLVLSGPGLRAEAAESGLPLEVIEHRAVRAAAADIAHNYEVDEQEVVRQVSAIVARYGD